MVMIDLDKDGDAPMMDESVLASTETTGFLTQPPPISISKTPLRTTTARSRPYSGSPLFARRSSSTHPPSKSQLKRENLFDGHLSGRTDAPRPVKFRKLPYATLQTGLVYDVRMRFHVEVVPSDEDVHPEDPRRIHAIFNAFVEAGLAWEKDAAPPGVEYQMGRINARSVTEEEVCLVHTKAHYDWVQSLKYMEPFELENAVQHEGESRLDSVYVSSQTPFCADLSAGGAIEACRAVMLGKVKNVFAVIRPPGHHAEREDVKGFCFYDNVSIATKVCRSEFGESCRKVLILDWDVHHGNGIQQANYDNPNVLYISLHVHENGHFYPELSYRDHRAPYGDHLHCGSGKAIGKNVNIPWRYKGMGDADYIYAFQQVVMPIATEFDPDLVIIAAGFDAAEGDMLGGCNVSPAGYGHMTHMLMSLANGKVAVCLEGGYNLDSIARSARAVARVLMGEPPDRLAEQEPSKSGVDDVKTVLRQQSRFWKCLYPKDLSKRIAGPLHGARMHDVVRQWQAAELWDKHQMMPLFVHRQKLSKSFENQVLATPNYMEARPLLIVLHESPEMMASPDPRTGKLELHNTWLTDIVKTYVDWAAQQGFGVIDVNLPKHITRDIDTQEHEAIPNVAERTSEAQELMEYLWENYIELNGATHVFLMGTNIGYSGIVAFIKNNERCQDRITKVIAFGAEVSLQSCRSATNELLAPWYHSASLVFLASEHHFWETDLVRKPKKKFGRLFRSDQDNISDMLLSHKDQVEQMLLNETERWRAEKVATSEDEAIADVEVDIPLTDPNKAPAANSVLPPPKEARAAKSPSSVPLGTFAPLKDAQPPNSRSDVVAKMPPVGNFALPPRKQSISPRGDNG